MYVDDAVIHVSGKTCEAVAEKLTKKLSSILKVTLKIIVKRLRLTLAVSR